MKNIIKDNRRMNKLKSLSKENVFIGLCLSLFIYQLTMLFNEYYQGSTVVRIEIKTLLDDGPPGITICPAGLNMKKMANINDHYQSLYQEYLKLLNGGDLFKFNEKYHQNVYRDIYQGILSFEDILNNYTYSYEEEMRKGNLQVELEKSNNVDFDNSPSGSNLFIKKFENAIESYSLDHLFVYKCFTYFSELNISWKNVLNNFQFILITLKVDKLEYLNDFDAIKVALHSPNDLPIISFRFSLSLTKNFLWLSRYSSYHIERLGSNYDTNCINYNNEHEFQTKHDCIKKCYIQKQRQICNGTALVKFGFSMQTLPNTTKLSSCPIQDKISMAIYSKCQSSCRFNCRVSYYSQLSEKQYARNDTKILISKNNAIPDITIKHIPEISFISFVCNFGGLLGMWLGLSFLQIFTSLKYLIQNIIQFKFKKSNVKFRANNLNVNSFNQFIVTNQM